MSILEKNVNLQIFPKIWYKNRDEKIFKFEDKNVDSSWTGTGLFLPKTDRNWLKLLPKESASRTAQAFPILNLMSIYIKSLKSF